MKIYFATTNLGKVHSLQRDLGEHGISVVQFHLNLVEPRSSDVKEIAKAKIEQAYLQIKKPTIVIDAGFYIDDLNGFPKAFVNFALETIGLDGMLKLVEGKSRECEFRECLAYMDSTLEEPKYFISHVTGRLSNVKRGELQKHLWSELGLIFIPKGSEKTLAEMSHEKYLQWRKNSKEKNSLGKQLYQWLLSEKLL